MRNLSNFDLVRIYERGEISSETGSEKFNAPQPIGAEIVSRLIVALPVVGWNKMAAAQRAQAKLRCMSGERLMSEYAAARSIGFDVVARKLWWRQGSCRIPGRT